MKKFCLTDCAKRKLTKIQDEVLTGLLIILIIIGFSIILLAIMWTIGFTIQWFGFYLDKEILDLGGAWFTIATLAGVALYWTYIALKATFKTLFNFTKNRIEGVPAKCKIFEECK